MLKLSIRTETLKLSVTKYNDDWLDDTISIFFTVYFYYIEYVVNICGSTL